MKATQPVTHLGGQFGLEASLLAGAEGVHRLWGSRPRGNIHTVGVPWGLVVLQPAPRAERRPVNLLDRNSKMLTDRHP